MAETTPSPRAYILGAEMKEARTACGLSMRAVAAKLDVVHSVLARWEHGDRVPSVDSVAALCDVLEVERDTRERLLTLAQDAAAQPENSVAFGTAGEEDQLAALMEFERNAERITNVSSVVIPGLLQTSDYARAIFGDSVSRAERDRMVSMRLGRRDVLTRRRNPVQYTAFLLEWALYQPVGDSETTRDQLEFLAEFATRDNVEIRLVPRSVGWTPIHAGQYVLLEFAKAPPVVLMEHLRSSVFLRDEGEVRPFLEGREIIGQLAMTPDDTINFIKQVIAREETTG